MPGWQVLGPTMLNCATVFPLDDLHEHDPDNSSCWCRPIYDDGILVHNSMDGREAIEEGGHLS
jgi:hypothetical protein